MHQEKSVCRSRALETLHLALRFHEIQFKPRLFFFDRDIWETAFKLKMQIENPASSGYAEALSLVLAHELIRLQKRAPFAPVLRGGLASWQQKKIAEYIEDHLHEEISLRDLAATAHLSPFHFARTCSRGQRAVKLSDCQPLFQRF